MFPRRGIGNRCSLIVVAVVTSLAATGGVLADSPVPNYLARRRAFLQEQDRLASGGDQSLSNIEARFDAWLQEYISATVREFEGSRLQGPFASATYFPAIRTYIEDSTLYKVLRRMPKGGALHLHQGASCSMSWVVSDGLDLPGCHVYWAADNRSASPPLLKGSIAFFNGSQPRPTGFRPAAELLEEVPDLRSQVLKLLTLQPEDQRLTSAQIWTKFDDVYLRISTLLLHRPAFEAAMQRTMEEFIADGVQYIELRAAVNRHFVLSDLDGRRYNATEVVDIFSSVLRRVQKVTPTFTARLIASTTRRNSPDNVEQDLELAMQVKAQRPEMIVGWDACGEEDANHPTLDYAAQLLRLPQLEAQYGVQLPLMLHAGESDWPNDLNIVDAVLLGARRVGHGFNAMGFPLARKLMKERDIALEVCPISNQVLRYVDDLRLHPAAALLREGLPVVLSSDDPGVWGAVGLTHDFWEAAVAWQLGARSLKYLARSSLEHSGLSSEDRAAALARWEADWELFLKDWDHTHGTARSAGSRPRARGDELFVV